VPVKELAPVVGRCAADVSESGVERDEGGSENRGGNDIEHTAVEGGENGEQDEGGD
jgi:hypothetical protein